MAMEQIYSVVVPERMIKRKKRSSSAFFPLMIKEGIDVREWYVNYDLLFIMVLTGAIIVVLQCVAGWLLGRLYRDCSMIGTTENPWIKGMIGRYEASYQLRIPITDISSFADKNIAEYRFQRLSMEQWADIGIYGAWIECFMMGITTLIGIYFQTSLYTFGIYGIYLILILAMIMGCDFFLQTHAHQKGIRVYLVDYMENTLRPRMENHYLHPEEEAAYQREYFLEDQMAVAGETEEENDNEQSSFTRQVYTVGSTGPDGYTAGDEHSMDKNMSRITREELSEEEKEALLSDVLEEYF